MSNKQLLLPIDIEKLMACIDYPKTYSVPNPFGVSNTMVISEGARMFTEQSDELISLPITISVCLNALQPKPWFVDVKLTKDMVSLLSLAGVLLHQSFFDPKISILKDCLTLGMWAINDIPKGSYTLMFPFEH